ncbi:MULTISPECIES: polyprenol phosphomannose-dependent alpha 1,6 mannosyltransferase MptB [unclassified Rathayibacter]|uniref:polyprenol phosphomannose-dependent alpha 1,6 mannosyltransferase MptB n=1 Tax=unclassified Rathayibacter TaxID=2609250 RepID=UPI000F908ABB|nr:MULTISPECIES: polyprenol phosphomannose-dependent alpha 1,6 mannosyltransferase MptB [unclassified Rathayibacter]ROP57024.1 hypothetical protein EDF45_0549 [Rathayibacter sp. PhB186]ROS55409.1 hypothetical protein EDF44_0549 [Rathayibacter sp. PhB185]
MVTRGTTRRPDEVQTQGIRLRAPLLSTAAPLAVGLIGSLAILAGSLAVGYLPLDSPIRSWPLIAALRASAGATELGVVAVVGGGILLLVAWLRLRAVALDDRPGSVRAILVAALAWAAPLLLAVPLFSRDMFSYVAQGRLMTAGVNPYSSGVATLPGWFALGVDPRWADTPTPYGPLYLLAEQTAVHVAGWTFPELSIAMLRALSVAGVAVSAVYALRLARLRGLSVPLTAWSLVANPLTLVLFVVAGHNDSVMIALILASLYYGHTDRRVAAVLLMGAAIAVKPVAVIALPVLALLWLRHDATLRERIRAWGWSGAGALAVVVAIGLAAGVGVGWIGAMIVPGSILHWYAPMSAVVVAVSTAVQMTGHDPATAIAVVKMLALLAAGLIAGALMLSRRAIDPLARLTGALLAFVTASTAIHPWYALWILPIAALSRPWRSTHRHLAVYATVFLMCVTLAEPVDGGGGAVDQIPVRVATIAAIVVVGVYVLVSYSDEEHVDARRLVGAVPFGSEILQRLSGGRLGAPAPLRIPARK